MATVDAEVNGKPVDARLEEDATVEMMDGSRALAAINRAELDTQILTAKAHPRSITAFMRSAHELATLDQETAGTMFYVLPRRGEDGKKIEGPSIRMAEIVAYAWGNIRVQARIGSIDDKMVTAVGMCFDIERNIAASVEVKRGITKSNGKRYSDDMVRVTCQAAMAIAYREAVFKVVPRSLFKSIYESARAASVGDAATHDQLRKDWLAWFEGKGITFDRVLAMLGRKGIEDINVDDLIALRGIKNALKEGDTTLEDLFPDPKADKRAPSPLNDRVKG